MVVRAVNSVCAIALIISLGYIMAGTSLFQMNKADVLISKYLTRVALPIYMAYNTRSIYSSREEILETFQMIPIPLVVAGSGMILGKLMTVVFRVQKKRRGVIINACGLGNIVFLGLPIVQSVLGQECQGYGITYYMVNTILFWTFGTYTLRKDHDENMVFWSRENVKGILSPPLLGFLFGICWVLLQIPFPMALEIAMGKVSDSCSALGMIFIGSVIRGTKWEKAEYLKDLILLVPYKFLLMPALMLILISLMPIPLLAKETFFILSLMPGMTQLGLMSQECGSDSSFAAMWIALSTVLCVLMIPLEVSLMTVFLH